MSYTSVLKKQRWYIEGTLQLLRCVVAHAIYPHSYFTSSDHSGTGLYETYIFRGGIECKHFYIPYVCHEWPGEGNFSKKGAKFSEFDANFKNFMY